MWGLVLALVLVGGPQPVQDSAASGRAGELDLRWSAPCGHRGEVLDAVERFRSETSTPAHMARVSVEVTADGTVDAPGPLRVEVRGPLGEIRRTVAVRSCEGLPEIAGVIIAVALDRLTERTETPLGVPSPVPGGATPEGLPVRAPQLAVSDEDSTAPLPTRVARPAAHNRPRLLIRPGVGVEAGALGGVGAAAELAAGLTFGHVKLELAGTYLPPRATYASSARPSAGANLQLGAASVLGCFHLSQGSIELGACGGFEGGVVRGRGFGYPGAETNVDAWFAGRFGPSLVYRRTRRFGLALRVEAVVHLYRPVFFIEGVGEAYSAPIASVRAFFGPEVRL